MRILFWGDTDGNNGPFNINKGIVSNLTEAFLTVKRRGKYRDFIAACWNLLRADVLVVANVSRKGSFLGAAAKSLGKQLVFIMHGCNRYEAEQNHITYSDSRQEWEDSLLKNADLLLPVSKRFMYWVHDYYPQYIQKTKYLYNGIDGRIFNSTFIGQKKAGSVAVYGGLTPLKNNLPVLQAVDALQGRVSLTVYGTANADGTIEGNYTWKFGKLPHDQFLQELADTQVFVLNSVFEPFSISVVEALACGCSVLVSEAAGVTGLLALEETDIIHDPMDVEEIRVKMEYLLDHPNYERLYSQLDIEEWTFEKMVQRLEQHCRELVEKK